MDSRVAMACQPIPVEGNQHRKDGTINRLRLEEIIGGCCMVSASI